MGGKGARRAWLERSPGSHSDIAEMKSIQIKSLAVREHLEVFNKRTFSFVSGGVKRTGAGNLWH